MASCHNRVIVVDRKRGPRRVMKVRAVFQSYIETVDYHQLNRLDFVTEEVRQRQSDSRGFAFGASMSLALFRLVDSERICTKELHNCDASIRRTLRCCPSQWSLSIRKCLYAAPHHAWCW